MIGSMGYIHTKFFRDLEVRMYCPKQMWEHIKLQMSYVPLPLEAMKMHGELYSSVVFQLVDTIKNFHSG